MDIGVIIALVVAITLTLISGILAGLFGGMWWQARKTAEVWEKAYTHVREQLPSKHETYNTGRGKEERDPRVWGAPTPTEPTIAAPTTPRIRVPAEVAALPPAQPSDAALKMAADMRMGDFDEGEDPLGPQVRR